MPLFSESVDIAFGYHFKFGVDTIHKAYEFENKPPFLYKIMNFYDKKGTANFRQFFENGDLEYEINFVADTVDFVVRINEDFVQIDDSEYYRIDTIGYDTIYRYKALKQGHYYRYYENGKLAYNGYYNLGTADSLHTIYYKSGQKALEGKLKNGERVGKWQQWNEAGLLTGINYHEEGGRPYGKWETWYDNGQPKTIGFFNKIGAEIGTWRTWYENGQLMSEVEHQGDLIRIDENGRFTGMDSLISVPYREWYENGQLKVEALKILDTYTGSYKKYYESGKLFVKGHYPKINNKLMFMMSFGGINDGKKGVWKYYDESGNVIAEHTYRNGEIKKEKGLNKIELWNYEKQTFEPEKNLCRKKSYILLDLNDNEFLEIQLCVNRQDDFWIDTFYTTIDSNNLTYLLGTAHFNSIDESMNFRAFYPNGSLFADYNYEVTELGKKLEGTNSRSGGLFGKKDVCRTWFQNGQLKTYQHLTKDATRFPYPDTTISYYENGQIKSIRLFDENCDCGTKQTWYSNGIEKELINYTESHFWHKNGRYVKRNKQGVIVKEFNYRSDELDGTQYYYDDNGKLIKEEYYIKGKLQN